MFFNCQLPLKNVCKFSFHFLYTGIYFGQFNSDHFLHRHLHSMNHFNLTGPEYAIRSGKGLGCVSIKFFCLYSEHFSRFRCEKQTWLLSPIIIVTGCTTHISRTLCNDTLQSKENNSPRP